MVRAAACNFRVNTDVILDLLSTRNCEGMPTRPSFNLLKSNHLILRAPRRTPASPCGLPGSLLYASSPGSGTHVFSPGHQLHPSVQPAITAFEREFGRLAAQ